MEKLTTRIKMVCTHPDGEVVQSPSFENTPEGYKALLNWCAERADEGCSSFGHVGAMPHLYLEA